MSDNSLATIGQIKGLTSFAASRLHSPGFLYNAGNILGLCIGLAIAVAGSGRSGQTLLTYFAGDASALCLTAATLVFFVSGAVYERAWQVLDRMRLRMVRSADVLSGVGALLLGASLMLVGQPLLALASAALNSVGKFGSALAAGRSEQICRYCRWLVLGSRTPGLMASAAPLLAAAVGSVGPSGQDLLMSVTLVACYLVWAGADFLLLKAGD